LGFGISQYGPPQHDSSDGNGAIGNIKYGPNTKIQEIDHVTETQAVDKIPQGSAQDEAQRKTIQSSLPIFPEGR